jgi:hypothetical protein
MNVIRDALHRPLGKLDTFLLFHEPGRLLVFGKRLKGTPIACRKSFMTYSY